MDALLPYYERELTYLRRLSHDFAKQYPKVAGRLLLSGETCEDPHIERLVESFAFLAGRIHKKLDDELPEVTDSLLQVVYPQYLRPFPSVSIAHFDAGGASAQLTAAVRIPRGTTLNTRAVRGAPCKFRTAFDVDIWPITITKAAHESVFGTDGLRSALVSAVGSVVRIDLSCQSESTGFDKLGIGKLRVFMNGDPSVIALLREALFLKAVGVWIAFPTSSLKIELPKTAITPAGFGENETLLEQDARTSSAYQLLLEYLAFPEKFNFFDLDLSVPKGKFPPNTRHIEIRIGVGGTQDSSENLLERIGKDNFVLGCTPIINLFSQKPEPIRVAHTASSYPIIVDSRRPHAYEIYDIRRVYRVRQSAEGEDIAEFRPFFSLRHGEPHEGHARYWHASHVGDDCDDKYTMELSLVDPDMRVDQPEANTLSLDLICTNRDLPSQLPFGLLDGDLFMEGGSIAKTIRMLRKPTPSYRFPRGRWAHWRLISHLSLNHLSLSGQGVDAIREVLSLHDISRSNANARQIGGIVGIEHRSSTARLQGNPFPSFVRGIEIRMTIDETHYAGIGLSTFVQILDRFFGLYVHTNSFTRLTIVSHQSGEELIKCPPRNGASILA
ncbi:type VI secretion system baseplate subunit TssF [Noviherbaspirillum agri]